MLKKLKCVSLIVFLSLVLVGCSGVKKTISYTYSVETGDNVVVKLDATDGYTMSNKSPFAIFKEDVSLSQGIFVTLDTYKQYVDGVGTADNVVIMDSGNKNGNEYISWSYDASEYNYAILIGDSKRAVLLANPVSEESAKDCFERIDFSVAK